MQSGSILIKPIITEKATNDSELFNRYSFVVDKSANKIEIKKAIDENVAQYHGQRLDVIPEPKEVVWEATKFLAETAAIAALTIAVGFMHFLGGVQILIEDYVQGLTRKALIVAMTCLSYGAAGLGVFAVLRIAL